MSGPAEVYRDAARAIPGSGGGTRSVGGAGPVSVGAFPLEQADATGSASAETVARRAARVDG